jgi:hypothetical protein
MKIQKRNGRTYIGQNTYLTERGEALIDLTKLVATVIAVVLAAGLFNVNVLTPQECRDGLLQIKDTPECSIHILEI